VVGRQDADITDTYNQEMLPWQPILELH